MTTAWHRQFCPEMGAGFGGAPGMRRLKQTPPGRSSGACRCGGPLAESRGTGSVSEFLQTSQLHTSRRGLKSLDFRPRFSVHSGGPSIRRRAYCAAPGLQPTMRRSSSKSRTAPAHHLSAADRGEVCAGALEFRRLHALGLWGPAAGLCHEIDGIPCAVPEGDGPSRACTAPPGWE